MLQPISATPFILEIALSEQIPIDVSLLEDCVRLIPNTLDLRDRRSIDFELYSDNDVKATSIKAYNLFLFSQSTFQISILKLIVGAAAIFTMQIIPTILGILTFMSEFMEKGKKEFKEQDAKVLFTIYRLGNMCHISTIPQEYQQLFNTTISEDSVRISIDLLARYRTVRLYSNGEVEIKETINLTRQ